MPDDSLNPSKFLSSKHICLPISETVKDTFICVLRPRSSSGKQIFPFLNILDLQILTLSNPCYLFSWNLTHTCYPVHITAAVFTFNHRLFVCFLFLEAYFAILFLSLQCLLFLLRKRKNDLGQSPQCLNINRISLSFNNSNKNQLRQ